MAKSDWSIRNLTRTEMDMIKERITTLTGITVRVELSRGRNSKGTVNVMPAGRTDWAWRELREILPVMEMFGVNFKGCAEYGPMTKDSGNTCWDGFKYLVKVDAA